MWSAPFSESEDPLPGQAAPFITTPPSRVRALLDLCDLRSTDRVLDLGCGDGRIVIEAARTHRCTGVGVDIDPKLVATAEAEASSAGVSGLVSFRVADFLDPSFSLGDATVVTIYGLPKMLKAIEPKVKQHVRSAAAGLVRIACVQFRFTRWQPSATDDRMKLYRYDSRSTDIEKPIVYEDVGWSPAF